MTSHRIKLVVEGLESDDGHVRLEVFVKELQKLQSALGRADARVSGGSRCSYFAVVGLSHNSPATVELEARVASLSKQDCRASAISLLAETIEAVERGEFTDQSDYDLLNDIKELSAPVGVMLKVARLQIAGKSYTLTEKTTDAILTFQADLEECSTTVEGLLEHVNVHADRNLFTIYPDVGPSNIKCYLPESLTDKGIGAIRRRVAITGVAKFRKFAQFPHEISAQDLQVYGDPDDLPTFGDLLGRAPNATGDLCSEDFIREARNEWI